MRRASGWWSSSSAARPTGSTLWFPTARKITTRCGPRIAIPQNQVIDLDGFFGLHPSLAAFKPLYDQGHLAIVHACGSPDMSRSHFDAQDYMESGTPGVKGTDDGWLNRALQAEDLLHRCAGTCEAHTAFRALALGADVPRTLAGKIPAIALNNVNGFNVARPRTESLARRQCVRGDVRRLRRSDLACRRRRDF